MTMELQVLAERGGDGVVVHDRSAEVRWELAEAVAADGHALRCVFACRVRALDQPTEKRMLAEALLGGRPAVGAEDVRRHFHERLQAAIAQSAQSQAVEHWLGQTGQVQLREQLMQAARAVAFGCGLEVLAPFHFSAESPTLSHQRVEQLQRQTAEQRAERRRRVAERAASALAAAGDAPPAIDAADEDERRDFLIAMIDAAAARATQAMLCAVSGACLLLVDPANPSQVNSIALPADLGPLRSVECADAGMLLIGAQMGVLHVNPSSPDDPARYRDSELRSSLGFNQCLLTDGRLWGCHGDGGIVTWEAGQPDRPLRATRADALRSAVGAPPTASPRHLCAIGKERFVFAMGGTLCTIDGEHRVERLDSPETAEVVAILPGREAVYVLRKNGTVGLRSPRDLRLLEMLHGPGPVSAAAALPCFGLPLRLIADDRGVQCLDERGLRLREFTTPHRDLRLVTATSKWITALSADRQRAVLWQTTSPGRAVHELHLGARTRHRVADLCWSRG